MKDDQITAFKELGRLAETMPDARVVFEVGDAWGVQAGTRVIYKHLGVQEFVPAGMEPIFDGPAARRKEIRVTIGTDITLGGLNHDTAHLYKAIGTLLDVARTVDRKSDTKDARDDE